MIVQGDMDYVPLQQGEEFFAGLYKATSRNVGKTVSISVVGTKNRLRRVSTVGSQLGRTSV